MYKYSVKIRKVSGRLNESVLPSKSLVIKSKTKKSKRIVLAEASRYFKNKYGLVIESADVSHEGDTKEVMVRTIIPNNKGMLPLVKMRLSTKLLEKVKELCDDDGESIEDFLENRRAVKILDAIMTDDDYPYFIGKDFIPNKDEEKIINLQKEVRRGWKKRYNKL